MAFLARHLLMRARELKGCTGMAEAGSRFPCLLVVTAEAVGAELVLMRLLVAVGTLAPQPQEGLVEIFHLDFGAARLRDLCGIVAAFAFLLAMLALQSETRLGAMIEALPVHGYKCEFRAAMFDMAARAIRLAHGAFVGSRVKACGRFYSALNLGVAFHAFEAPCSEIMAGGAFGDAVQLRVSARQRTRCNLRHGDTRAEKNHNRTPGRNFHSR